MKNRLLKFCIFLLLVPISFLVINFNVYGSQENNKILEVPKLNQVGNGCGPTSLDMVLRYFGTNSEEYNYRNMFTSDNIGHLPKELIEFAQSRDMLVRQSNNGSIDNLVEFIDNGIPVLVLGVYKGTELKDFLNSEELNKFLGGEDSELLSFQKYYDRNNMKSMHWMAVVGYNRNNEGEITEIYFNNPNSSHLSAEYYTAVDFQSEFWNKNVIPEAKNYFLVMAENNTQEASIINQLLPKDEVSKSLESTLDLLNNFYDTFYNLESPGYKEEMLMKKGVPIPIYVDKDMLLFNLESGENDKSYNFSSDYELVGGVDWIVYTIKLKPEDISSKLDLSEKTQDNRITFSSEATDIETIFVPAKSAWKWLDFTSAIIDIVLSGIIDQSDSVELQKDEEAIYLVRAYSGGFGLQDDKEERRFVIENVNLGKDRHNNALIVNVINGSLDAVSLVLSFADTDSSDSSNGKIVSKAVGMIQKNLLLLDTKEEMTADDLLIVINDIADFFVTEYTEKLVEKELKNLVIRAGKFLSKSADKALGTVNVFKKVSKGGQIANRAFTLIYTATPLESAYIVNKELPERSLTDFGIIEGSISFPSEGIPDGIEICAIDSDSLEKYCTTDQIRDSRFMYGVGYELEVPVGIYYVQAFLGMDCVYCSDYKAYYTQASKCEGECDRSDGSNWTTCTGECWKMPSDVVEVEVKAGEIVMGVNPTDMRATCVPICTDGKKCVAGDCIDEWKGNGLCIPTLVYPLEDDVVDNGSYDGSDKMEEYYDWIGCEGATLYDLNVSSRPSYVRVADSEYTSSCVNCYRDIKEAEWKVRAKYGDEWGEWSDVHSFQFEPVDTDIKINKDEKVKVWNILICYQGIGNCDSNLNKEEAFEHIKSLRSFVDINNFSNFAITFSDDPSVAVNKGNLGWIKRGDMVKEFEDVVFSQKIGTFSDVFETQYGYHITYKQCDSANPC